MATLTLTIPDALVPRIFNAFATTYRYDPASGVGQGAFIKAQIVNYVKSVVINAETDTSTQTAAATTKTDVTTNVTIT